jgi:hypothetical protein
MKKYIAVRDVTIGGVDREVGEVFEMEENDEAPRLIEDGVIISADDEDAPAKGRQPR